MVKLVILDVDGILTNGRKYYGADGMPVFKTFCDKDFTAIKRLRGAGVKVCFLSGDKFVNKKVAENRNIDFYHARDTDKGEFVEYFERKYGVDASEMIYIGDDLFDISIMQKVKSFCPVDAPNKVKESVTAKDGVLPYRGGDNLVMRLVDRLLEEQEIPDCSFEAIKELDKDEVF